MLFDTHIHIDNFAKPEPLRVLRDMDANGVDKVGFLAEEPAYYEKDDVKRKDHNKARLERLMQWGNGAKDRIMPIYFIDPTEPDAKDQVDMALDAGVIGFKIICETFYPGDDRAMPVYAHIAECGKSILFHSGILWDWGDNGKYNRPVFWECMMQIPKIKFALAHISWPWCDECLALFGKFAFMTWHPDYRDQKMYIDMTPGTPIHFRRQVFRMMQSLMAEDEYPLADRLLFGTDQFTNGFDAKGIVAQAENDTHLLLKSGFYPEVVEPMMGKNALEFWGIKA